MVPSLTIWDPQVFNSCKITKRWLLNDKIVIDVLPTIKPGSTPNGNFSLSDLIEGVSFEFREHPENGGPEGRFWSARGGSPKRRVPKIFWT